MSQIATLQYHASLLADEDRVDRLRAAIHEVVRPGDVVVDIGTGTGLLAYFACQAGAARVFAIDDGPVIDLARELARLNGFDDRVEFFHDLSYRVELPERADVLITETLWNFGLGEGMAGFVADACRRLLKPGARVIPSAVELHVAPVQADRLYALLHDQPADRHGIDLSPIRHYLLDNVHMPHLDRTGFLSRSELLLGTELDASAAPELDASVCATVTKAGVLHGICGWFRSRLSPGVEIHNEPPAARSSWAHAFFAVQDPVSVLPGDEVTIAMQTTQDSTVWRWRIDVHRAGAAIASYDQTSSGGFPAAPTAPAPATSLRGEVVAWVLAAMDGTRSAAQLEAGALERFGSRFAQPAEAVRIARDTVRSWS